MTTDEPTAANEQLAQEKKVKADESNGKQVNDASAARYTAADGDTQRGNQKDQLENLHIGGSESEPQGAITRTTNEQQQGPGFEVEGSYELDHDVRAREQKFGETAPSGPAQPSTEK